MSHHGHVVRPYRYVDWGIRPGRGLAREIAALFGDAAKAMGVGLREILRRARRRRRGVLHRALHEAATGTPQR